MMSIYKVLITGKNNRMVDDAFTHLTGRFRSITCSNRLEDMVRHIETFEPDVFLICLNGEKRFDLAGYVELKRRLTRLDVPTVIFGSEGDCTLFEKVAVQMADLKLIRPISMEKLKSDLFVFMERLSKEKAEQEEMLRKLEELKAKPARRHVLVVDDDPLMLRLVKEYLSDDYDVATAISGKIAHKFLEMKHTDLILLDYEMPVQNGPAVLEEIRADERLANVPVLFLTGVTEREKIRQALARKPQGYLIKPIDKEKLLGTIEKFIG